MIFGNERSKNQHSTTNKHTKRFAWCKNLRCDHWGHGLKRMVAISNVVPTRSWNDWKLTRDNDRALRGTCHCSNKSVQEDSDEHGGSSKFEQHYARWVSKGMFSNFFQLTRVMRYCLISWPFYNPSRWLVINADVQSRFKISYSWVLLIKQSTGLRIFPGGKSMHSFLVYVVCMFQYISTSDSRRLIDPSGICSISPHYAGLAMRNLDRLPSSCYML